MEGRHQGRSLSYQIQRKRVYTTYLDLGKEIDASAGTRRGNKNKQKHDFSASRADIGIHNANAPQIASAIVGDHQLRNSHQSPTKADVKR